MNIYNVISIHDTQQNKTTYYIFDSYKGHVLEGVYYSLEEILGALGSLYENLDGFDDISKRPDNIPIYHIIYNPIPVGGNSTITTPSNAPKNLTAKILEPIIQRDALRRKRTI